jgi:hypothetical protein
MEARDVAAVVQAFAPDANIHSPLTARLTFTGHDQIGAIISVIFDVFDDLYYTDELHSESTGYLVSRARVDGQDIKIVDLLRLGRDGKIQDLTVLFRPLRASAAALRLLGGGLGRRQSRARGAFISNLTRPFAFMSRAADRIGVRLVEPTF